MGKRCGKGSHMEWDFMGRADSICCEFQRPKYINYYIEFDFLHFKLFDNNLSSEGYKVVIDMHLAPFMHAFNQGNCRFLQDNAPTHVTDLIYESLRENNIRWVKNYQLRK